MYYHCIITRTETHNETQKKRSKHTPTTKFFLNLKKNFLWRHTWTQKEVAFNGKVYEKGLCVAALSKERKGHNQRVWPGTLWRLWEDRKKGKRLRTYNILSHSPRSRMLGVWVQDVKEKKELRLLLWVKGEEVITNVGVDKDVGECREGKGKYT